MKKLCAKLRAERGETISEVLVSLLVAALALVLLASMVLFSTNMIDKSRTAMAEYYEKNNESVDGTAKTDGTVSVRKTDTSAYGVGQNGEVFDVRYTENDENAGTAVIFYRLAEKWS